MGLKIKMLEDWKVGNVIKTQWGHVAIISDIDLHSGKVCWVSFNAHMPEKKISDWETLEYLADNAWTYALSKVEAKVVPK